MINKSSPRRGVFLGVFISLSLLLTFTGVNGQADPQISTPVVDQAILDTMRENMHIGITPDLSSEIGLSYSPEDYAPKVTSSGEWGKLIIQAYVSTYPANAEIFTENGNGTNPVRLTDSPGFDGSARLSPDESRVVFVSTRDGDSEIYIMDIDGSDLVQVTFNTFSDSRPYWSPDGSQLVYAANERGYYEIYRINADGSGRVRLSNYNAGFNAYEPAWAPDGSMIAFVLSDRMYDSGGNYIRNRLWALNPDGSNPRILCAYYEVSYAGDLFWSDDSRYLSFDNVYYGGIVSEVNIYDRQYPEPSGADVPQVPGHLVDQWNAGFSSTGNEILYTNVHYEFKSNHFIIIEMIPMLYCLPGKECRREPLQATLPFSFDPSMIQYDFSPPVTTFQAMPEYNRCGYSVTWSAEEVGQAGVYGYELLNHGEGDLWWNIDLPTPMTTKYYNDEDYCYPGVTFSYRVRAYDRAGNLEEWSDEDEIVHTTIFNSFSRGALFDNRENPLDQAQITFSPLPMNLNDYISGSTFNAFLPGASSTSLNIGKLGYKSPPLATFTPPRDYRQDYFLATADDIIVDGTFENDPLVGWTLGGDILPEVNTKEWFTGQHSLQLGTDCDGVCLSGYDGPSIHVQGITQIIDKDGVIHSIALVGSYECRYYTRSPDGTWSDPVILFSGSYGDIRLLMGDDGTLFATFTNGDYIEFRSKAPLGEWSELTRIDEAGFYYSEVIMDHEGKMHIIARTSGDNYYLVRRIDGSWMEPVLLDSGGDYSDESYSLIMDNDGEIMVIGFRERPSSDELTIRFWNDLTGLSDFRLLDESFYLSLDFVTPIHDTLNDSLYLFWSDYSDWRNPAYLIKQDGYWFGPMTELIATHTDINGTTMDSIGSIKLVVPNYSYDPYDLYEVDPFRMPILIGTIPYENQLIGYDSENNIHLRYSGSLQHKSSMLAVTDQSSFLTQDVTIPADMNKPTLSFVTRIEGGGPLPGTSFDVVIIDGGVETAVFSENTNHLWEHHWVAMDDYLGKTVTVKFVLDQKAGEPVIHVDLDDVSLSGWNMLSVSSVAPSLCLNDTTPITVTGVNFATSVSIYLDGQLLDPASVVWVNDQTVTINLPLGYQPGVYDLTVENPGGFQYTLPHAMIVGCPVFIPCAIK
jgi:hypothetical protein